MTSPHQNAPDEKTIQDNNNQFRYVVDVLTRHRALLVVATLMGGVIGAGIGAYLHYRSHTEAFNATATLYVKPSVYDTAWLTSLGGPDPNALTPAVIRNQISDRTLADEVARALIQEDISIGDSLASLSSESEVEDVARALEGAMQLEVDPDTGILHIHAQGPEHDKAERRAEMASRVLIEHSRRRLMEEQERVYSVVQEEIERLRSQLDSAESRQWAYREEIGFQTHAQAWEELERKTTALREARAESAELVARLHEIDADLVKARTNLPLTLGNVSDAAVEGLKTDLDDLIGRRAEMQVVFQPDSEVTTPLTLIEDQIDDKREAIRIAVANLGPGGGAWETYKSLFVKKVELEFQLSDLDIKAATLSNVIGELEKEIPQLAERRFQYQELVYEADQARSQFSRMIEKQFELKTAQNREMASLEIRDPVSVAPVIPARPASVGMTALTAAAIAFIAAFAFGMMRESMDTSIRTPEDITNYLQLDVIGTIPLMKFGRHGRGLGRRKPLHTVADSGGELDACVVTRYDPKSPISEAYRSLRTNFQFATIKEQPKTVMITSAVPGEGKTTTAVNFAVTMADLGLKVLLVDTDLRRPHVHHVLKMDRGPGLADALRKQKTVEEVIRSTAVENLSIISSGRVPSNPSELIGSDEMKRLLDDLTKQFDLVVCDAPSLHVVTDPVLLATNIDSVVMVISVSNARRETVQRAKKFLETANPHIAGVVLNGLEATRRHYYYYYYYYDNALKHPARTPWFQRL